MRIGVIADTHIPKAATELPEAILKGFEGVDMILHAGDLVELKVLDKLNEIAPTEAVSGNMDSWNVRDALPSKKIINASGFKIGLIHGWGPPNKLCDTLSGEFSGVDAIVFGHSHEPMNERRNGILYFNPGTPTDKVFASRNSYGILEIDKKIEGKIIILE